MCKKIFSGSWKGYDADIESRFQQEADSQSRHFRFNADVNVAEVARIFQRLRGAFNCNLGIRSSRLLCHHRQERREVAMGICNQRDSADFFALICGLRSL